MRRTLPTTLTDYVFWMINPLLIMLLLDSFTLYLLESHYDGENKLRLTWAFLFFNMGIVACARISLMEGATAAEFLAVPLLGATIFVIWALTSGPFLAIVIVLLLSFLAFRLAKNTTILDEAEEASSQGLVGRFFGGRNRAKPDPATTSVAGAHAEVDAESDGPASPLARLQDHLRGKRAPETPGLWVLYVTPFTLLAMGLSSWFMPEGSRTYAMPLLAMHLGCAMVLLATATFLNLRRYLRQRLIQMPESMTGIWVASAAAMLAAALLVAMILPRPALVQPLKSDLIAGGWWDQQSDWAFPWEGTEGDDSDAKAPDGQGEPSDSDGGDQPQGESPGEKTSSEEPPTDGSGGGAGQGDSGAGGEQRPAQQGESTPPSDSGESASEQSSSGSEGGASGSGQQGTSGQGQSGGQQSPGGQSGGGESQQGSSGGETQQQQGPSQPPAESSDPFDKIVQEQEEHYRQNQERVERHINWSKIFAALRQIVLYLFWLVIFLATIYMIWRFRAQIFGAFEQWWRELQEWLARILRWGDPKLAAAGESAVAVVPPRPFHAYADPFQTGAAARWNLRDLLAYSQEALDAWSRDHAFPRGTGETPGEFAARLAMRDPTTRASVVPFADVYSRAAFAPDGPPGETVNAVRALWAYLSQSTGRLEAPAWTGAPALDPRRPVPPPPPPVG